MRPYQEDVDLRENLRSRLKQFENVDYAPLVHAELGEGASLEPARPYLQQIAQTIAGLVAVDFERIPANRLRLANSKLDSAIQTFSMFIGYGLKNHPNNLMQQRTALLSGIQSLADECFEEMAPIISYDAARTAGNEVRLVRENTEKQANELIGKLRLHEVEAAQNKNATFELAEKARQQVQEIGISKYAKVFRDEAESHEKSGTRWLQATIGLSALTGALAVANVLFYLNLLPVKPPALNTLQVIPLSIAKLLVFSGLFAGTIWAGKIYRAHRHNAVVNRHRQNALSTFETFVVSASDQQTKNAVLLQATQSIFSPQQTGYMTTETDSGGGGLQIMKILETVVGEGKGKA
jgi:hypothetical protein